MAILYGTQSNGETLPVLVDQFGNLLAKGIEGQQGPEGPPGPDGGSFPLPPDPYEGAFLGWLNNGLAWIGTPPVPIPEGVFGPITAWNSSVGLTVEGEIPSQIAQGVRVYQCNQDGSIFVDGWNTTKLWSSSVRNSRPTDPAELGFDGNSTTCTVTGDSNPNTIYWDGLITGVESLEIQVREAGIGDYDTTFTVSGDGLVTTEIQGTAAFTSMQSIPVTSARVENIVVANTAGIDLQSGICQIQVNGSLLVDSGDYPTAPNLNFFVQSVSGQNLVGTPNRTLDFSIGKYLRVPEQNVARWLYDGNLNKVITTSGIDISRLTGN